MSLDVYLMEYKPSETYTANVTHNLAEMAAYAGLYEVLWRPDENGYKKAGDIVEELRGGLEALKARPDYYKQFNPENGWGSYDGLVNFVSEYLKACEANPHANIEVSR